ncbi:MAG: HAD family phosphatase [Spirochaetales bacterium]|nr:HAD family phosphatase [Spirochaetales bacterium]
MKITTIIFDFGGVISLSRNKNKAGKICKILKINEEQLASVYQKLRYDYDSGLISAKEYWKRVIERLDIKRCVSDKEINAIIDLDRASWMNINKDMIALINALKKKGFTLAILSNMPANMLSFINRKFKWLDCFDYRIFSCEEKMSKPRRQVFITALNKLNEKPEHILFIDDSPVNIEVAEGLGLHTIHYRHIDELKKELSEKFGVD